MADGTVAFALERIRDFLTQQVNIRIGVKDGVRWLKDELGYLQPAVRYAEARQTEEVICKWVNDVRDVANDAVTILQKFRSHQEEYAGLERGILDRFQTCICICKRESVLCGIGKDIEILKKRITVIKKRRNEYGINDILATPNVQQKNRTLLRTTAIDNQVDVVGFEDDIKALMAQLDSTDPSLKVISIHGMGGLGKTSLATKLYNSNELSHFDTRAKVCVSMDYNIKDVLKRLIKSFMGLEHEKELSKMDEQDLLQHTRKLLQGQGRYIAVIDDIWDIKAWEVIKIAFPNDENGSRIIITTRNKKVAETVDDKCFVHQLQFLKEEESWKLFCKKAKPTTPTMEKLGMEMVGKCGGLPLAIVVLSGLLLQNRSYEYWSKVKEHIWRHLKDESVDIEEILSLSYDNLSSQIRDCFLYLARFPGDHIIGAHQLKLLWIAEELIPEDNTGSGVVKEDLANDYLNDLISRNLIQIATVHWNGKVLECRVHDLVHELARNKAMEHKLLVTFDSSQQHRNSIHLLEGQPRQAIYNGIGEYFELSGGRSDCLKMRSLALNNLSGRVNLQEMKLMYTRFKKLKVLDLTSVNSERIPEEIGDLVLLKFLGLMGGISEEALVIPPSIGKLKRLQTLCGSDYKCYKLPREIWELKELRHLTFGYYSGSIKIGNNQKKLETLSLVQYKDWLEIDTGMITNLHTLSIVEESEDSSSNGGGGGYAYTLQSIADLTSLQTLSLSFFSAIIPTSKPLSY
nr:PREDICTED: putative disease resistance RPP13-like protein 3 [Daucus carota subsp. sativus]